MGNAVAAMRDKRVRATRNVVKVDIAYRIQIGNTVDHICRGSRKDNSIAIERQCRHARVTINTRQLSRRLMRNKLHRTGSDIK